MSKEEKKPLVKDKAFGIVKKGNKVLLVEITFDLDQNKSVISKIIEQEDLGLALAQLNINIEDILFREI